MALTQEDLQMMSQLLDTKIQPIKDEIRETKKEIREIKDELQDVKADVQTVKTELQEVKADVQAVKTELQEVKDDVQGMKTELQEVKDDVQGMIMGRMQVLPTRCLKRSSSGFTATPVSPIMVSGLVVATTRSPDPSARG